jgi:hypothetical protein
MSKNNVMKEPCIPKYFLKNVEMKKPTNPADLKISVLPSKKSPINAEAKIIKKEQATILITLLVPKPWKRKTPNLSNPKKNKQNGTKYAVYPKIKKR